MRRIGGPRETSGCAPELFCPKGIVVRDQMASFISRAVGLAAIDSHDADTFLGDPAWSPDGASLAVTLTSGGMFASTGGVAIVDPENDKVNKLIEADLAYYSRPVWSPDGRFIAVTVSDPDMSADAVVIEVDTGIQTTIATRVLAVVDWVE